MAAAPAVSIDEIWRETACVLDTQPAQGGLLPLPSSTLDTADRMEIADADLSGRSGQLSTE